MSVRLSHERTKLPIVLVRENTCVPPGRFGNTSCVLPRTVSLKSPEQSFPPHQARMHQRVRVRKKTLANLPRLPGIGGDVERHVYHHRRADNIVARYRTPETAVIRVSAVIAHHKITVFRNLEGLLEIVRVRAAD